MKIWIKVEDGGEFIRIIYYVNLINKFFFASILKRKKNKKRWSIRRLLITRKIRFTPIIQNYIVVSEFTYFELEDDKIKFDIPCPK